ncbi:MAG: type VI secretion system membrane-associated complex protein TssK [Parabacteroides sp.]|nr:type VI secretion system membrane-associated complex protein TssK [Parabacteroides sp.]
MKKHKLVNWQGQMKLSADHFRQTEDYFIEGMNDIRSLFLGKYDYGLLPLLGQDKEVEIRIREHMDNQVEVNVYCCNAVTASGERINFNLSENETPLSKTYSPQHDEKGQNKKITYWDVILSVNPYQRVASGEPDPLEEPLRHPECESAYKLHIMPSGEFNSSECGPHFLNIGKIRKEGNRYLVDQNYIPPCRTMSGHPELAHYFKLFEKSLYGLRQSCKNIIAKVNNRPAGSELAVNIRSISERIFSYLASIHFRLKNFETAIAPVTITEDISTLASLCYVCLVRLPGIQKDELLKYFYEWSDVTPGAFEEMLADTMEITYEHYNLRSVMVRLETFLNSLGDLWEHLNRLEYIGQHKESLVVSARGGERNEERHGFMVSD